MSKLNNIYLVQDEKSSLTVSDSDSLYIMDNLGWNTVASGVGFYTQPDNFYQFIVKDSTGSRFINFGIAKIMSDSKTHLGGRYSATSGYTNWGECTLQLTPVDTTSNIRFTWKLSYCSIRRNGSRFVRAWLDASNCTLYFRKVNI